MTLPMLCAVAVALAGCAVSGQPTAEGLVAVPSSRVDELQLRPNADLSAYRGVLIDPVPVELHKDWLTQMHAYNRPHPLHPIYQEPERVARDSAASVQQGLAEAFRARGYEIVAGPGAGVLRVSAKVTELFINAPDRASPWELRNFTREAGDALLTLEARDAAGGSLLARVKHRAISRQSSANMASDVSNRMWLDALLRRWAASSVAELARPQRLAGAP